MELITKEGVELVKIGDWPAMTGPAKITQEKLNSMVEASKSQWWDGSPIGIGHFDQRFLSADALKTMRQQDGTPALGGVKNLRVINGTLVGDLVNMPKKFADVMPLAWPRRSIKWEEDFVAPDGQIYPAVLRRLDVLGVTDPGVAGLAPIETLEDVYELYAASASEPDTLLQSAFVGDDADEFCDALSTLSKIIRAPLGKTVHNSITVLSNEPENSNNLRGDQDVTDILANLREMLSVDDDESLEAEIRRMKEKAETPDPSATPAPVEPVAPTPSAPVEPEKKEGEGNQPAASIPPGSVIVTEEYLQDLAAKANAGAGAAKVIREQQVEAHLQAASKDLRLAPAEYEIWREFMLASPENETVGLKMLSQRPALVATQALGSEKDLSETNAEDEKFARLEAQIFGGVK